MRLSFFHSLRKRSQFRLEQRIDTIKGRYVHEENESSSF